MVGVDVVESVSENGAHSEESLVDSREAGFEGLEDIKVRYIIHKKGDLLSMFIFGIFALCSGNKPEMPKKAVGSLSCCKKNMHSSNIFDYSFVACVGEYQWFGFKWNNSLLYWCVSSQAQMCWVLMNAT